MNKQLKVGLMVQGTGNEEAWSIAQGGFGIAATLDEGWFGNGEQNNEKEIKTKTKTKKVKTKNKHKHKQNAGIYMTSSFEYAKKYAFKYKGEEKATIVIAAVSPGNPFPIVESPSSSSGFKAKACRVGYQSHSVIGSQFFRLFFLFISHFESPSFKHTNLNSESVSISIMSSITPAKIEWKSDCCG